ncbi:hypothetical protein T492DRAFT_840217 [Pavlovales sp. CCMP2436]|nr:hypothetical protein T492DRAFT_840217 [Pavlovales sp. CCMP2436]
MRLGCFGAPASAPAGDTPATTVFAPKTRPLPILVRHKKACETGATQERSKPRTEKQNDARNKLARIARQARLADVDWGSGNVWGITLMSPLLESERQFSTTGKDLNGERSLLLPTNVRILSLLALNDEWLSNETATAKLCEHVPKLNTKEREMVIKQMEAMWKMSLEEEYEAQRDEKAEDSEAEGFASMSESDGEVSDVSEDE